MTSVTPVFHKKKRCFFLLALAGYGVFAVVYLIGRVWLADLGLEYREAITTGAILFLWTVPILWICLFLGNARREFLQRKQKKAAGVCLGILIAFIVISVFITAFAALFYFLSAKEERKMPDGNLVIAQADGSELSCYYAEPVYGIARRRFDWDTLWYAEALSRIYDTEFTADGEDGAVCYRSEDYWNIPVQLFGTGYTWNDYLDENLRYLLTGREIEKKGQDFWADGAVMTTYVTYDGYEVTALAVQRENISRAADRITEFIREELADARRADGRKLWEKVDGSIYILLTSVTGREQPVTCNIPFSADPAYEWIYDDTVQAADMEALLERCYAIFEEDTTEETTSLSENADEETLILPEDSVEERGERGEESDEESNGESNEEGSLTELWNQMQDGYVAIYSAFLAEDSGNRYLSGQDAKGNTQVFLYEDDALIRFLKYDRVSANGACLLYVYYEADKASDGSYSPGDAHILTMYAYVPDTGEVIDSGKKAWDDTGTEAYREATGE